MFRDLSHLTQCQKNEMAIKRQHWKTTDQSELYDAITLWQ
jgi:hypothetical protein